MGVTESAQVKLVPDFEVFFIIDTHNQRAHTCTCMYSIFYFQPDSSENDILMIFITIILINVMKAVNVNMFREKQLLIPGLLLLCVLMSAVSAKETADKTVILNSRVELHCSLNASNQNVTWEWATPVYVTIATCTVNTCVINTGFGKTYEASRNETSSTLSILHAFRGRLNYRCLLGGEVEQIYIVNVIEVPVISPPNCNIIPTTSNQGKNVTLRFSCESHFPSQLPYHLTMLGFSENISTGGKSDLHVKHNIDVENFRENLKVVCELRLSDVDISESCSFPNSANVTNIPGVRDAIFDCHADPDDAVTWQLLDSEGRKENMTGRSWTRDGGRSLLIKNITKQDFGKVAECRTNGSVGFGVIDEIGSSENDGSNGTKRTYDSHGDRLVYVVLTFVFGGLLLLTLLIIISHWRCGVCAHPMKWYAQFKLHGKLTTNQLPDSTGPNVSGGGSNSRSPGRDVLTTESNLNSGNQNNSALNHPRDPTPQMKATSSSDAGASSSVHPDQPVVDSNQHTYFCVERSTPPPSLPDLSTSGPVVIYQDPDYEESHGERLRDSAGYDVVDASKKKVNNNFDMDDYAEVGGAYDMTSNSAIAPRSSKGWTGKRVVSSDPAVLYGKVNK